MLIAAGTDCDVQCLAWGAGTINHNRVNCWCPPSHLPNLTTTSSSPMWKFILLHCVFRLDDMTVMKRDTSAFILLQFIAKKGCQSRNALRAMLTPRVNKYIIIVLLDHIIHRNKYVINVNYCFVLTWPFQFFLFTFAPRLRWNG